MWSYLLGVKEISSGSEKLLLPRENSWLSTTGAFPRGWVQQLWAVLPMANLSAEPEGFWWAASMSGWAQGQSLAGLWAVSVWASWYHSGDFYFIYLFNFKAALWLLQFCYRIDPELYSVFDPVLWPYSPVTCNRQGRCSLPVSVAVCTGHYLLFQCVDVSFTTSACLLPLLFFSTDYKGSFTHVTF